MASCMRCNFSPSGCGDPRTVLINDVCCCHAAMVVASPVLACGHVRACSHRSHRGHRSYLHPHRHVWTSGTTWPPSRRAARAQKHEEHRRICSPESSFSHQCKLARWCARITTWGFGWEGACTVRSLRHFIALSARILVLHTGHVRHRGGQQQRQQIVACACACEFVARLWGESKGSEQTFR